MLPALTDWRTYSSGRGTVLELIDPLAPDTEGYTEGQMMIFTDPPFHDTLRGLVSRSFTPRRVGSMEARVRELCRAGLDEVAGAGSSGFDYLGDFAGQIPAMVIGELLGIPKEDQRQLGHWTDQFMHYDPDLDPPGEVLGVKQLGPVRVAGMKNLVGYLEATIDARTAAPADDMISALVTAEVPLARGRHPQAVAARAVVVRDAAVHRRGRDDGPPAGVDGRAPRPPPRPAGRLRGDRSLLPGAVEELLRYESPSPIQARWVTRDVELHGEVVPRGSKMALLNASANRDERHFLDADRFDIARTADRNVAFGYSAHFCLGAALARLEGRVVLDETLDRLPEWQVDESPIEFVRTTTVRGPAKVPITF